jgi:hypothetical protein
LRAGLLSDRKVIDRLNRDFVCTSLIVDDAKKLAAGGDELARQLAENWQYPVEMMFFAPDGKLVSKLNSYKDFPGVHSDVASPSEEHPGMKYGGNSHIDVFLKHLAEHFGKG